MSEQTMFEQLNQLNVNDHVEKKQGLSYLSWSYAHQELMKIDPNYEIKVHEYPHPEVANEQYFVPYLASPEGYSVTVSITLKGLTKTETLPVLDMRNKAVAYKSADMFQINKTYKRATVKCAALHGIGLYLYHGESSPETPFEGASESEVESINSKVTELSKLMNMSEGQIKTKMKIGNKISTHDAEEITHRLENGITQMKTKGDK